MKLLLLVIAVLAIASASTSASPDLEQAHFDEITDLMEEDSGAALPESTKDNVDATLDELTEDDLDVELDEAKKKKNKKVDCSKLTCPKGYYKSVSDDKKTCSCQWCKVSAYGGSEQIAPFPGCESSRR